MEAKRKRKALADCTNTIPPPSSIKKPSFSSAIKKVLSVPKDKSVIQSKSKSAVGANAADENPRETGTKTPSSSSVASTPAKSSSVSGAGDESRVVEPCSVYSRRRTAEKRKYKGKEVALPLDGSHAVSLNTDIVKSKEDGKTFPSKSSIKHRKKKKEDDSLHTMSQDFIEKQRAYFAEIDAFELSEEEASDQSE
ncbi:hypothetical protein Patl1_06753 [Pistacia atlantica]|uniref:Uncharacterized protein n=1 Tax=Pistacia atlantica TaxID=434234 RepID=A0ACC1BVP3_9ROSI|nr:hypothetical protein Patl1_06753 [Pistacia atlantica]